jgi:hypothetical protein
MSLNQLKNFHQRSFIHGLTTDRSTKIQFAKFGPGGDKTGGHRRPDKTSVGIIVTSLYRWCVNDIISSIMCKSSTTGDCVQASDVTSTLSKDIDWGQVSSGGTLSLSCHKLEKNPVSPLGVSTTASSKCNQFESNQVMSRLL